MPEIATGVAQGAMGAVTAPMSAVGEMGRSVAGAMSTPLGSIGEVKNTVASTPRAASLDGAARETLLKGNTLLKQESGSGPLLAQQLESFITNNSPHNALEFLAQGKTSSPEDSEKNPEKVSVGEKPVKSDRNPDSLSRNQLSKQELDMLTKGSIFSKEELRKMTYETVVSLIRMKMQLLRQQVMVDRELTPEQRQKALRRIDLKEKKLLLREAIKHEGLSVGKVIAVIAIWLQELMLG